MYRFHGLARSCLTALIATNSALMAQTPTLIDQHLAIRTVVSGLVQPTTMAFTAPNQFFVLEKASGKVQLVTSGVAKTVLDLAVNNAVERGLLGIALHPYFSANHYVYLYWTCTAPAPAIPYLQTVTECADMPAPGADSSNVLEVPLRGNRLDRFIWDGNTLVFDRNLIKLHAFQYDGAPIPAGQNDAAQAPAGNHNGGILRFGPDGKLYLIFGDNGRRGQLQNLRFGPTPPTPDDQFGGPEPDNNHMSGVVLRLNDDGTAPLSNPFFAYGATVGGEVGANLQKVFAYGVRNSFGMAFDPQSGDLWDEQNGDDTFDEINRVEAGQNGGWVQIMGPVSRIAQFKQIEVTRAPGTLQQLRWPPTNIADTPAEALSRLVMLPGAHYSDPEFSWKYSVAPAGIGFLSGRALGPQYEGNLFVGASRPTLAGGYLFRFRLTGNRRKIAVDDPRLEDRVADNLDKFDITESESLLFGSNFGVVTDIHTGPNGNLYLVSLSTGKVYEIYRLDNNGQNDDDHGHHN